MKIYTLIKLQRIEDSETISLSHFRTKDEALKALHSTAEDDIMDLHANELIETDEDGDEEGSWCHDEITDNMESYSSWEDGYECHNHFSLSINEGEL